MQANILIDENLERYVLGCLFKCDENIINKVMSSAVEIDFGIAMHKKILSVINDIHLKQESIDLISFVREFLNKYKNAQYDEILTQIASIENDVVTTAHLDNHLKKLKELSYKRQMKQACDNILEMTLYKDFEDVNDYKEQVFKKLDIKCDMQQKDYDLQNSLVNFMNNLEEIYQGGQTKVVNTGFEWLDKKAGGLLNGLTYIGARPSIGKTTFVINVINNLIQKGKKVIFFNLEMSTEEILSKTMAIQSNTQSKKIREAWELEEQDWISLSKAYAQTMKHAQGSYIIDDKFTIEDIKSFCVEAKARGEIHGVFIDYIQLIGSTQKHQNRYALVTEVSRQLKMLQKELKVPVWCLAQMNRTSAGKFPEIHELKESGGIEQDADRVFLLHDENAGKMDSGTTTKTELWLNVAKNRFGVRDVSNKILYYKNTQRMYER